MASIALDPITLEIMNKKVCAIADEISATLLRSSRSIYVNEAADFAVGLIDLKGEMFGWAPENKTTSINVPAAHTLSLFPKLVDGDVIITNDPYLSRGLATHLPDLHLIQPYFHGDTLVCYGWCFIHFMDVGGRVPGSIAPSNHELFQEGIRIPPMKLASAGEINQDFITIFQANCRLPHINMRDIESMKGALGVGRRRVLETVDQYGIGPFMASHEALKDYAATKVREVLRRLPDGTYDFWEYIDGDGRSRFPVRVRVRLTVDDGRLHFDFTGTDPAVAASYNIPTMGMLHNMFTRRITTFVRTHDPTIPLNAGTYRPMTCTSPPGTLINAEFPDAVGLRFNSATALNDAVGGTLLRSQPELMAGPTCGSGCSIVLSEPGSDGKDANVTVLQAMRGGMSAYLGHDGVDVRDVTMNTMHNHPLEAVEAKSSILITEYDVRTDSGGAGRWRGGVGQMMTFEVLRNGGKIRVRGNERVRFPPWGVAGGRAGANLRMFRNRGRADELEVSKIEEIHLDRGDTLTILMPGAAGYGDPFLRDAEAVRSDVGLGFVGRDAARKEYGVVIDTGGNLDAEATRMARRDRLKDNIRADFDFGPEREAWEAVFNDETMCEINRRLFALPRSVRQERRRQLFDRTVPDMPAAGTASLLKLLADADKVRARLKAAMDDILGTGATAPRPTRPVLVQSRGAPGRRRRRGSPR